MGLRVNDEPMATWELEMVLRTDGSRLGCQVVPWVVGRDIDGVEQVRAELNLGANIRCRDASVTLTAIGLRALVEIDMPLVLEGQAAPGPPPPILQPIPGGLA